MRRSEQEKGMHNLGKFSTKSFSHRFAHKPAFSPNRLEASFYHDMTDPRDITIRDLIDSDWLHGMGWNLVREYFAQVHLPF